MTEADTPRGTGLFDSPAADGFRMAGIPQWTDRLSTWQHRLAQWGALRDVPLYREDPRIAAARQAERTARQRLSVHHATQHGHLFSNRRIPRDHRAATMGRFKADLIAITARRVVVVEVKNWSGQLYPAGGCWIQVQRSGEQIQHPDLLVHNREKLRALYRYLMASGVKIDPDRLHQGVVFVNPRLSIAPEIARHPAVLRLDPAGDSLGSLLGEGTSLGRRAAARIVQWLVDAETTATLAQHLLQVIPPVGVKAAADAIGALRSWDRLALRGGRELQGDIVWLRVAGTQVPAGDLQPGGASTLHWGRSWIGGLRWVMLNTPPGSMRGDLFRDQHRVPGRRVCLKPEDCVYFHEPGTPKPDVIALSHVERIQLG